MKIKYPFTLLLVSALLLIPVFILWAYLDFFCEGLSQYIQMIFGICVGSFCMLWCIIFFSLGQKLLKTEQETREKDFITKVKKGTKILLVKKRTILANLGLIIGVMLMFLTIIIAPWQYKHLVLFIPLILISIILILLGIIFSFIKIEKYIEYKDFQIYIKGAVIKTSEIVDIDIVRKETQNKSMLSKNFDFNLEIRLKNEQKIICEKADVTISLKRKIDIIKSLEIDQSI